jgi:pyridinium-3,5-bisthiocarboxylic acid mononucleotide nickel chelatase
MDKLFKAGALDVFLSSIIMKKGRPAVKLSVLSKHEDVEKLSGIIFNETSTIGIRRYLAEREVLERKIVEVECRYGTIRVKDAYHDGKAVNHAPEYEDVKKAALQHGVSIKDVYNEVMREYVKK